MTSCISVGISDIVWSREKSDLYVENPVNLERLSKENLRKSQRCKIVISLPTIEPKQRNEIIHLSIVTNSRGNSQAGCLPVATKLRTVDSLNAMHHANASALVNTWYKKILRKIMIFVATLLSIFIILYIIFHLMIISIWLFF